MRYIIIALLLLFIYQTSEALRPGQCEVCLKVIKAIDGTISDKIRGNTEKVRSHIEKWCKKSAKVKQDKSFCWKIGADETSASSILSKVATPLTRHIPPERICERLKKADADICDMTYPKPIDLSGNLNKMRVKTLKKVLSQWGETCKGCYEKRDYVKRIQELRPIYEKQEL